MDEKQRELAVDQREVEEFWYREGGIPVSGWVNWLIRNQAEIPHGVPLPIEVDEIPITTPCQSCDSDSLDCDDCDDCYGTGEIGVEICEWWGVGSYLGRDLAGRCEVIIDGPHGPIWGRQTTGQAVWLDSVIQDCYLEVAS